MRKFSMLFLLMFFSLTFSQVKWMTLSEAIEAQKSEPRKIIIDFYADWCGPCKTMDKTTFNHPVISQFLNEKYYLVKFNAEGNENITIFGRTFTNPNYTKKSGRNPQHDFTKFMNVNAVPTLVFLDENTNPITILQGALTAKELEPYLPFFANDDHKKMKTREEWENYQRKFKSKIKD